MFEYILFDLDGTLVDSMPTYVSAMLRILDENSIDKFDYVLADVPCSGLGVLAKKTDLKYKMTPETEKEVADLQRQILKTVHRYVKPGGTLIYSTCTICRAENEENVKWFVENYPEFELKWEKQILPGRETDGFYIAKFSRRSS